MTGIHTNQPACVRISAIRAVAEYCNHLSQHEQTHVLEPYIGTMVEGLISVTTMFSTDVISLCLDTLDTVLQVTVDNHFSMICSFDVAVQVGFTRLCKHFRLMTVSQPPLSQKSPHSSLPSFLNILQVFSHYLCRPVAWGRS